MLRPVYWPGLHNSPWVNYANTNLNSVRVMNCSSPTTSLRVSTNQRPGFSTSPAVMTGLCNVLNNNIISNWHSWSSWYYLPDQYQICLDQYYEIMNFGREHFGYIMYGHAVCIALNIIYFLFDTVRTIVLIFYFLCKHDLGYMSWSWLHCR